MRMSAGIGLWVGLSLTFAPLTEGAELIVEPEAYFFTVPALDDGPAARLYDPNFESYVPTLEGVAPGLRVAAALSRRWSVSLHLRQESTYGPGDLPIVDLATGFRIRLSPALSLGLRFELTHWGPEYETEDYLHYNGPAVVVRYTWTKGRGRTSTSRH